MGANMKFFTYYETVRVTACVISSFLCGVNEIIALLRCHTA
jgi:hypothetical protein